VTPRDKETHPLRRQLPRILLWLGRLAVSTAALGIVWKSAAIPGLFGRWTQGNAAQLIAAALLLLLLTLLNAARWRMVVRTAQVEIGFWQALRFTLAGMFFNQTLFPSLAGEVAKIWLARRAGIPIGVTAATVIVDRALALAGLALLAGFILMIGGAAFLGTTLSLPLLALVVLIAGTLALLMGFDRLPLPRTWIGLHWLGGLADMTRHMFLDPGRALPALTMSVLIHLGIGLAVYLMAQAVEVPMRLSHCLLLVPPVMLLTMLPISLAGWGIREGAMMLAFAQVGISAPDAFLVSITFGATMLALGLFGGLSLLFEHRKGMKPG
jgi:uncharacterized membrane protein YbhN (UPF0104 family)